MKKQLLLKQRNNLKKQIREYYISINGNATFSEMAKKLKCSLYFIEVSLRNLTGK